MPVTVQPCHGLSLLLLCSLFSSMTLVRFMSTIVTSPSAPGARLPFRGQRFQHLAGFSDWSFTYWLIDIRPSLTTVSMTGTFVSTPGQPEIGFQMSPRSEERRVGKECRARWAQDQ